MPRFRDDPAFGPTIDAAAETLGISPTAVDKDYWISEVLRALAVEHRDDFIFKGGTSLSKGYRLIERFSDDVDLLVLPRGRGRSATDTLMKAMADTASVGIGGTANAVGGRETGVHRSYDVTYPTGRPPTAVIRTAVLLEMGVRGGELPHAMVPIGSLLADVLVASGTDITQFDDLVPFEVPTLHPGRTLLEKFVLVHDLTQELSDDPSKGIGARNGRHPYDIYQLLNDAGVRALLADREAVDQIMTSVANISRRHFDSGAHEIRPGDGFAQCPAFHQNTDASSQFRAAYEATMPELYFGKGPLPSWDEVCARVADNRSLL